MVLFQRSCFLIDGRHARLTPTKRADLMRFFEARPLLHEIGCALGKAHNVFHLKGVLRRPLETTPFIRTYSAFALLMRSRIDAIVSSARPEATSNQSFRSCPCGRQSVDAPFARRI